MNFEWRWPHFSPEEVLSPDGLKLLARGVFPLRTRSLDKLEEFRTYIRSTCSPDSIIIVNFDDHRNRGWRSPKENYGVQRSRGKTGWEFSYHMAGCAFDIHVPGLSIVDLHRKALNFMWRGVGLYETWVHIDDRDGPQARW